MDGGVRPMRVADAAAVARIYCEGIAWASASPYRPARAAYAHVGELSVYGARAARGSGAGRAVLLGLVEAAREAGAQPGVLQGVDPSG
jgi:L-amino acid N-acyltransferase YncA